MIGVTRISYRKGTAVKIMNVRRRIAAATLGVTMVGALAACGDDADAPPETVTETVTAEPGTTEATETTEPAETPDIAGNDGGGVSTVVFDGDDIAAQFPNVRCREDDGDDVKIDLWSDDRTSRIEIDLDVDNGLRVDDIDVDHDGKEWESTDAQEREATVEVDGDTYRVTGQVEVDDDYPDAGDVADLEVEVSCA